MEQILQTIYGSFPSYAWVFLDVIIITWNLLFKGNHEGNPYTITDHQTPDIFEHLTAKDIKRIENRLNHRPRKSLGWKTPYEVFHENLKAS